MPGELYHIDPGEYETGGDDKKEQFGECLELEPKSTLYSVPRRSDKENGQNNVRKYREKAGQKAPFC